MYVYIYIDFIDFIFYFQSTSFRITKRVEFSLHGHYSLQYIVLTQRGQSKRVFLFTYFLPMTQKGAMPLNPPEYATGIIIASPLYGRYNSIQWSLNMVVDYV